MTRAESIYARQRLRLGENSQSNLCKVVKRVDFSFAQIVVACSVIADLEGVLTRKVVLRTQT